MNLSGLAQGTYIVKASSDEDFVTKHIAVTSAE